MELSERCFNIANINMMVIADNNWIIGLVFIRLNGVQLTARGHNKRRPKVRKYTLEVM